eukprot:3961260-Prymnesium_polylepis.1
MPSPSRSKLRKASCSRSSCVALSSCPERSSPCAAKPPGGRLGHCGGHQWHSGHIICCAGGAQGWHAGGTQG